MTRAKKTGLSVVGAAPLVCAWLIFGIPACSRPGALEQKTVAVPLDDAWIPENYRAGQGSPLGALAIQSCEPITRRFRSGTRLRLAVDFEPRNADKRQGECWWNLEALGLGRVLDLAGGGAHAALTVPLALSSKDERARISGGQLIWESESVDGHRAKAFSKWHDFTNWWADEHLSLSATVDPAAYGHVDPDFTPFRIVQIGIKLALNSAAAQPVRTSLVVSNLRIAFPTGEAAEQQIRRWRDERRPPSDEETLRKLARLDLPRPASSGLPGNDHPVPKTGSVRSVQSVAEPGNPDNRVWAVDLNFVSPDRSAAARSARLAYQSGAILDLRGKRLTANAAVGPSLRGFAPRPNRIQFELVDEQGRTLRGPAQEVSSGGISFDSRARESQSNWIEFEVSPRAGMPLSMGFIDEGFQPHRIREVGIRFVVGKFSNEFRLEPYPLTGTLLLSEVRIDDEPRPNIPMAIAARRPPVTKPPVPIEQFKIGINYGSGIQYGFDVGLYPFGGRDRCGFSTYRRKLARDFARLAESGIRLVRVFLLDDLRSGVRIDADGSPLGLDRCVVPDIQALIEAASTARVELIPVAVDFFIADGASPERAFGTRRWREGEYPQFLTDATRRAQFLQNVIRPLIRALAEANQERGDGRAIFAVDAANEIENAVAIYREGTFDAVKTFVQEVVKIIGSEGLKTTLGSRNRRDLVNYFSDLHGIDYWQAHHYDAMEEEERQPLHLPAGELGLNGPVILGELEPSDIERKLDTVYNDGYDGVLFWSAQQQPLDGFNVDLAAIKHWLNSRQASGEAVTGIPRRR
jgi:hypothetical protein